jgi:Flp pilus assembly protein TadG
MYSVMKKITKVLLGHREGAVMPLVGLTFASMVLASGFAIDYTRAQIISERLQWAVDAAALAGAKVAPQGMGRVRQEAEAYFAANFPSGYMGTRGGTLNIASTNPSSGYGVRFEVNNMTMENYFADMFGVDDLRVDAAAEVRTVPMTPLDVAISLDLSGSMNVTAGLGCMFLPYLGYCYSGTPKIVQARAAINGLIDTLHTGNGAVRFGAIGWDTDVNLDGQASPNGSYSERVCSGCIGRSQYFTTNKNTVKNAVNAMSPSGNTDGALGMLWAYRMFHNGGINWHGWQSPQKNKAIVLLTDGINTSYYGNGSTCCAPENAYDGNARMRSICSTARSQGINVYTIAYDMRISDFGGGNQAYAQAAHDTLRDCASTLCPTQSGGKCYFNAYNSSDLSAAMTAIGNTMMTMRLTR